MARVVSAETTNVVRYLFAKKVRTQRPMPQLATMRAQLPFVCFQSLGITTARTPLCCIKSAHRLTAYSSPYPGEHLVEFRRAHSFVTFARQLNLDSIQNLARPVRHHPYFL